jgi:hypothetical protein
MLTQKKKVSRKTKPVDGTLTLDMLEDPEQMEQYYQKIISDQSQYFTFPVDVQQSEKALNELKYELQSISHEKHVIDVLSKDILDKVHLYISPENYDLLNFNHSHQRRGEYSYRDPVTSINSKRGPEEETKGKEIDLNKPIPIAEYIPPYLRGLKLNKKEKESLPTSFSSSRLHAKSTNDTILVPNMKTGSSLPEHLQNLKISSKAFEPLTTKKKKKKTSKGVVSFHDLQDPKVLQRFAKTEHELKHLKDQLAKTNSK